MSIIIDHISGDRADQRLQPHQTCFGTNGEDYRAFCPRNLRFFLQTGGFWVLLLHFDSVIRHYLDMTWICCHVVINVRVQLMLLIPTHTAYRSCVCVLLCSFLLLIGIKLTVCSCVFGGFWDPRLVITFFMY